MTSATMVGAMLLLTIAVLVGCLIIQEVSERRERRNVNNLARRIGYLEHHNTTTQTRLKALESDLAFHPSYTRESLQRAINAHIKALGKGGSD